jgi:ribosome-associated toxin RatA of RatAB toxin-antitoxin module
VRRIKFSDQVLIKCTPTQAFDLSQDYERRLEWDTFLRSAELIGGSTIPGEGVKSYCEAHNGIGMETEYITFDRPNTTAVRMTDRSFIFRSFLGSWNFKEIDEGLTKVDFLYSFQLNFPFNLMQRFILGKLKKDVRQRLQDLKIYLENTTDH